MPRLEPTTVPGTGVSNGPGCLDVPREKSRSALGAAGREAYDRAVNRDEMRGQLRPMDAFRTLYLLGKLVVLGLALLVLLVVLGLLPRRRARAVYA